MNEDRIYVKGGGNNVVGGENAVNKEVGISLNGGNIFVNRGEISMNRWGNTTNGRANTANGGENLIIRGEYL